VVDEVTETIAQQRENEASSLAELRKKMQLLEEALDGVVERTHAVSHHGTTQRRGAALARATRWLRRLSEGVLVLGVSRTLAQDDHGGFDR
jgi:hypothetical protein